VDGHGRFLYGSSTDHPSIQTHSVSFLFIQLQPNLQSNITLDNGILFLYNQLYLYIIKCTLLFKRRWLLLDKVFSSHKLGKEDKKGGTTNLDR